MTKYAKIKSKTKSSRNLFCLKIYSMLQDKTEETLTSKTLESSISTANSTKDLSYVLSNKNSMYISSTNMPQRKNGYLSLLWILNHSSSIFPSKFQLLPCKLTKLKQLELN